MLLAGMGEPSSQQAGHPMAKAAVPSAIRPNCDRGERSTTPIRTPSAISSNVLLGQCQAGRAHYDDRSVNQK